MSFARVTQGNAEGVLFSDLLKIDTFGVRSCACLRMRALEGDLDNLSAVDDNN